MKKFDVRVYRDGGWFRKYLEEFTITADVCETDIRTGVVSFWIEPENRCTDTGHKVAEFKADKYTIISA